MSYQGCATLAPLIATQVEGVGTSRGLEWWERRGWLMMLPDMFLRDENRFRGTAEEFRADQPLWWREFAEAFKQLTEAGMQPVR